MCLHLDICIVVFGSFREEGDSNSVMDLSHIDQDKMLPEVSFGQPRDEDEKEKHDDFHSASERSSGCQVNVLKKARDQDKTRQDIFRIELVMVSEIHSYTYTCSPPLE